MHEYEFEMTDFGCEGWLPCGEKQLFATEEEYHEAYTDEENEFVDEMARLHYFDEMIDYPEDWNVYA